MAKDHKDFFKVKNEWSKIKDNLLKGYLPQYFQKLLATRKPIYYVDCFAGKGIFDNGEYGSPLIALEIIEESIKKSQFNPHITACFIEPNHYEELNRNLDKFRDKNFNIEIINGKFEDKICNLLKDKSNQNVFLYIDPYGIKSLNYDIFKQFKNYNFNSFEMLINFNSFGFFRDACRSMKVDYSNDQAFVDLDDLVEYEPTDFQPTINSHDLLSKIAGGDYWQTIVQHYEQKHFDGYKAEQLLSTEYKDKLKKQYQYVLDIPIRIKKEHRPKYRMIHVSNHEDGCFLMAANMQNRKDELFTNIQQKGQRSLFDITSSYSSTTEGKLISENDIERKIKNHFDFLNCNIKLKKFLASFCNEYGILCPFKMIYKILGRMEQNEEIDVIRTPATTSSGKKSSFWEEKGKNTITIRRHKQ